VALSDTYPECVAFVCKEDAAGVREPRGTAFFVCVYGVTGAEWGYLVTARHLIEDGMKTWVRLRRRDGGSPHDEPVSDWTPHKTADVAITPCQIPPEFIHRYVPDTQFADRWDSWADSRLVLSDQVWFIGLLAHVETMAQRAIPMVRSGILGASYQEDIPFEDDVNGSITREPCAHLIDCHSVGGFSGSPVFIGQPGIVKKDDGDLAIGGAVALLGVLLGHFVGPNAGIAAVVPVEAIRELLDRKDAVDDRETKNEKVRARRREAAEANAGVRDSVGGSEYQRFEDLTRKLVNTPKPKPH